VRVSSEGFTMDRIDFFLPSMFTALNLFFGFFSIVSVIEGNLSAAAWYIILAVLFDGMDGKLARWAGSETKMGYEFDSFADFVSAGIAPALLAYRGGLYSFHIFGMFICFLFVFCGCYRLVRFNVIQGGSREEGYIGLPIPIAGITIASLWIFDPPFKWHIFSGEWVIVIIFLALLMVSSVHFQWPTIDFKRGWKKRASSCGILFAILMMALYPNWTLLPIFIFYIILSLKSWFIDYLKGNVKLKEFFITTR